MISRLRETYVYVFLAFSLVVTAVMAVLIRGPEVWAGWLIGFSTGGWIMIAAMKRHQARSLTPEAIPGTNS
jgi:hypothetical protein